ncbi:C13 family peptidase [Tsuneonella sp. HG249]
MRLAFAALALTISASALAQSAPASVEPPPHISTWPNLGTGQSEAMQEASFALGPELRRGRLAREVLAERRKLDAALSALQPHRKGTVDAYVVSVALDSDAVFAREAREAGRVLATRYGAVGRTVTLAGPDGRSDEHAKGSIESLTIALARIAELIDPTEDVLVLYLTSHGAKWGLAYHEGDTGYGVLSPYRLGGVFAELGIRRRMVLLSACYSGVFVPYLGTADSVVVTAASSDRSSFGCEPDNDWTFFGDALINRALRKPGSFALAAADARSSIAGWEAEAQLEPSDPQIVIGSLAHEWLRVLDARVPKAAGQPVGRPAMAKLGK